MKAIRASKGIAIGKAFLVVKDIKVERGTVFDKNMEVERLQISIKESIRQIRKILSKVQEEKDNSSAEILSAHIDILEDKEFISEMNNAILDEGLNPDFAVLSIVNKYVEIFNAMEDKYLKERAADFLDVGNRIIANIKGLVFDMSMLPEGSIIIAKDLLPSDTAQMDKSKVEGFVTEEGGVTSHTAIIARTLGIPAIVGAKSILSQVKNGDVVIIDGINAEVIINPEQDVIEVYKNRKQEYLQYRDRLKSLKELPAAMLGGRRVQLEANIGVPGDVEAALENGAEGIGLFRTEFLYMDGDDFPSEDKQFEEYRKVVSEMGNKPVTIRTLDIGGDKDLPYYKFEKEMNPFLGCRAIRFSFEKEEIFKTQLRAILRASIYGNVSIMYPMISDVQEVIKANNLLDEAKKVLQDKGIPYSKDLKIGIMIEIPSAAMTADILAKHVDFFSIGTNDLAQYTLAVDRINSKVKNYYNYFNPGVIRLIKFCIEESHKRGIYTAMCGEMAADPTAIKILLGLELDVFSMSATAIPEVKEIIRNTTHEEAQKCAEAALQY